MWEIVEKGFEEFMEGVMLTSTQIKDYAKDMKEDQTLIIIYQCLNDVISEIVVNVTTTK